MKTWLLAILVLIVLVGGLLVLSAIFNIGAESVSLKIDNLGREAAEKCDTLAMADFQKQVNYTVSCGDIVVPYNSGYDYIPDENYNCVGEFPYCTAPDYLDDSTEYYPASTKYPIVSALCRTKASDLDKGNSAKGNCSDYIVEVQGKTLNCQGNFPQCSVKRETIISEFS